MTAPDPARERKARQGDCMASFLEEENEARMRSARSGALKS
jgi:hypothetical protein